MRKVLRLGVALAFSVAGLQAMAEDGPQFLRTEVHEVVVNPDLTSTDTVTFDVAVTAPGSIGPNSEASFTFYPDAATLAVVEAWVDQPDGTRLTVPAANIFTRPSAAAQQTPGFVSSLTTTVVFPHVQVGSRTHLKVVETVTKPSVMGFNASLTTWAGGRSQATMSIAVPEGVPLHWGQRGGVNVTDTTSNGLRRITAVISENTHTPPPEPHMVSPLDVQPVFLATNIGRWEEIGALYARQNVGKAAVTPEIKALADRLTQGKSGLDAARAIYDWVAQNQRYVAVYLDAQAGYVSHSAAEALANGYGDCKDHVVLMQALLAAVGIRAEPALVNWSNQFKPLPIPYGLAFNHAMIYLPDYDVYANPTNPFAAFEALDAGLSGKLVVIATDTGEVRQTPATRPADNRYHLQSEVRIEADGTIRGANRTALSARIDSPVRQAVATQGPDQVVSARLLDTPEGGFGRLRTTDPRDLATPFATEAQWASPQAVTTSATAIYATVPVGVDFMPVSHMRPFLSASDARTYPILVGAQDSTWEHTVVFPDGFVLDGVPAPVDLGNAAGSYSARYILDDQGRLHVTRRLVVDKDVYEPADYPALQALIYRGLADLRTVLPLKAQGEAAGGN